MESSGSSISAGFVVQSDNLVPAEETGTSPRPAPLPLSQNSTSCFCRLRPCEKGRTSCQLIILLLLILYTFLGFCSLSSFDQVTLCCLQGDEAMVLKLWTLEPVLLSVSLQSLWFINLQIKNKNKRTPLNHSLNRFLFKKNICTFSPPVTP